MVKSEILAQLKDRIFFTSRLETSETLKASGLMDQMKATDLNRDGFLEARELDAMAVVLERKPEQAAAIINELGRSALVEPWPVPKAKTSLAQAALDSMNRQFAEHQRRIAETGVGVYVGSESEYVRKMGKEERKALIASVAKPGTSPVAPRVSSCVDWLVEHTRAAYTKCIDDAKAAGDTKKAAALQKTLYDMNSAYAKSHATGFAFCMPLIAAGWKVYFFAPDSKNIDTDDPKNAAWHKYQLMIAEKTKHYYGMPLSGFIKDYRPTPGATEMTVTDLSGIEKLERVPFYMGMAKAALHCFVGSRGVINEFHWEAQPGSEKKGEEAITETKLTDWPWSSGVILVPPDEWPTDERQTEQVPNS